jgi:hypothetical protein
MKVKVRTKSNFRNLNDQWLELVEVVGTRVTAKISFAEFGTQTVDFTLSEVVEMDTTKKVESNLHPIFEQALKPFF